MPVIDRQVEPQFRLVHAIHQQPAIWNLRDRHPGFKLRVNLEGISVVIKKSIHQLAGVDQQAIQLEAGQYIAGTFL
ncbi:Uncharacterised protein [Enterobacter cloacae]|nr:Uncharacterised protein [Enterobacter cloacae]